MPSEDFVTHNTCSLSVRSDLCPQNKSNVEFNCVSFFVGIMFIIVDHKSLLFNALLLCFE